MPSPVLVVAHLRMVATSSTRSAHSTFRLGRRPAHSIEVRSGQRNLFLIPSTEEKVRVLYVNKRPPPKKRTGRYREQ